MGKIKQLIAIAKYFYFLSRFNPIKYFVASKEFIYYYFKRQFSPEEIMLYNLLFFKNPPPYTKNIYSNEEYLILQKSLNPASSVYMTESKIDFYNLCVEKGIPTPKTLFHIKKVTSKNSEKQKINEIQSQLHCLADGDFIVKPSAGTHGKGIYFFSKLVGLYKFSQEPPLDHINFSNRLNSLCGMHDYLIQERITNHTEINKIAPSNALQTLRINSLIIDEDCSVLFCEFKQAGHGQLVDNCNMGKNGAISWVVNIKTGELIRGYQVNENGYGYKEFSIASLSGTSIPFWLETIELVKSTSKEFFPLKTIGWDVAITDKGPIIIEGNCFYDPSSAIKEYDQKNIYQTLALQKHCPCSI